MMKSEETMSVRRVVLGVTGSIAAYKSAELIRLLKKSGIAVQALMTASAGRFIGSETLKTLTGRRVYENIFTEGEEWDDNHISLATWAQAMVIAPATANTIARLAAGLADDIICSTALVMPPDMILLAPAMNTAMWENPATVKNMALLRERGMRITGPDAGDLACGVRGAGRMSEPSAIAAEVEDMLNGSALLRGCRVLITAGPTREWLDDVRFISNSSSGRMGFALAAAAMRCGAEVEMIIGPVPVIPSDVASRVKMIKIETAEEMKAETERRIASADVLIMSAAVSDYRPAKRIAGKIKRKSGTTALEMVANPDIVKGISQASGKAVMVGFALEASDVTQNATEKLKDKGLDLVVGNGTGSLGSPRGNFVIIDRKGNVDVLGEIDKSELAIALMRKIADLTNERENVR